MSEQIISEPARLGEDAKQLAEAVKRILAADRGELAGRLDRFLDSPLSTVDSCVFIALFGESLETVSRMLGIEPRK